MNELEKIRAWSTLKQELSKIYDYNTRVVYYKAFLARACNEWGFNPDKPGQQPTIESVELDDWEKEFVEDINDTIVFGIDVRKEKRQKELDLCHKNMRKFIRKGNTIKNIPNNLLSPDIVKIYVEELLHEGDELLELADSVINQGVKNDGQRII